ncbi:YcjX family protein [Lacimicrobium sp. SS2-24]|uniref:YcjX family protein n=1 Tax=Lacimicrobium sp. SS2-24 TaxID=2005569 RepID=UPI001FEFB9C7|nr:YcjX family protein [Lacimicrobium sp. SS2-24]
MIPNEMHRKTLSSLRNKAQLAANRMTDQHVRLAVTGLSGAGKTAFITSLVNQLLEANHGAELAFFSPVRHGRIIGVQRASQPDLQLARFEYEKGMDALNNAPLPVWPSPTRGVSQIRLNIRYRQAKGLRRLVSDTATLVLDIIDYPGEWLLDLPLLDMDFTQWSQYCAVQMQQPLRQELAADFLTHAEQIDWAADGDEMALERLASQYRAYLRASKQAGLELIQPGRFVLPGELEGAPILQFVPVPESVLKAHSEPPKGSNLELVTERFRQYKEKVVKPFYRQYFKKFDRQIILVDCLSALNRGKQSFYELQEAINWLLKSYDYGSNSLIRRLFSSRIDKLVFAASKADHITPDQQDNLIRLLESMVHSARQDIAYQGCTIQTTAFAAIRASQVGKADYQGTQISVLKGRDLEGNALTLYPGDVPSSCPQESFWQHQHFEFPAFSPPQRSALTALPHIRMDQLLEFLLGDKLQ